MRHHKLPKGGLKRWQPCYLPASAPLRTPACPHSGQFIPVVQNMSRVFCDALRSSLTLYPTVSPTFSPRSCRQINSQAALKLRLLAPHNLDSPVVVSARAWHQFCSSSGPAMRQRVCSICTILSMVPRQQYSGFAYLTCATRAARPTADTRRGCVQIMLQSAPRPSVTAASRMYWGT